MFADHCWVGAPAWQIARAVQRGDASATAVVADHLEHARLAGRVLDALRTLRDAASLAEAETVDEQAELAGLALAGVPVLVGEEISITGLARWESRSSPGGRASEADDEVVRRLRGAGALMLGVGRAGVPDPSARTRPWGVNRARPRPGHDPPPRNPWRGGSPGGHAGGLAAAVAAGVTPIAVTSDRFGSLPLAAARCGVLSASRHGYGLLATTVTDAAIGLAVIFGGMPDRAWGTGRLRVGVCRSRWPVRSRDERAAVAAVARVLVDLGHDVVTAAGPAGLDVLLLPARAGPPLAGPPLAGPPNAGRFGPAAAPRRDRPAVTVPVALPGGVPGAVQLVGASPASLLRLAAQIEQRAPWRRHAPGWPRVRGNNRGHNRAQNRGQNQKHDGVHRSPASEDGADGPIGAAMRSPARATIGT